MGTEVTLENVRCGYAGQLFTAKDYQNQGKPRYGLNILIDRGSEHQRIVEQAIIAEANAVWKDQAGVKLAAMKGSDKFVMRSGDAHKVEDYHGKIYLALCSVRPVPVVDRDPSVQLLEISGKPYGGCYVNVVFDVYAAKVGGALSGGLKLVQFVGDGPPIGGSGPIDPTTRFKNIAMPGAAVGAAPVPGGGLI